MDTKLIKELDTLYSMHTYNRLPVVFVSGKGCKLYDSDGHEYTDFLGGIAVNCLGYSDPELTQAIAVQAAKLVHTSNYFYTEERSVMLKLLLEGSDFTKAFLCNSGAEANEAAIKLVRKYFYNYFKPHSTILTAFDSFHGRTLATVTATGQEKYSKPFAPLPEGFRHVPYNDIPALSTALESSDVGAVMLEPILGESGVHPASLDYLRAASELCKSKGIFLILDEVQTGVGRTGKMFCYEHYGIVPDIVTLAKGLGGGIPAAAMLARGDVAESFVPGDHGTTFGGNSLACKAASVVLNRLKNTPLLETVTQTGSYLFGALTRLKEQNPLIKEIRGKGLLVGISLDEKIKGADVVYKMLNNGYVVNCCGGNTLRLAPPYCISKKEIDGMVFALKASIAVIP